MLKEKTFMNENSEKSKPEVGVAIEVVAMSHIRDCINKIFTEFTNQEMGNRISQFNMQGLANILISVIQNPNSLKNVESPESDETKINKTN
jgi:hypothetical protein